MFSFQLQHGVSALLCVNRITRQITTNFHWKSQMFNFLSEPILYIYIYNHNNRWGSMFLDIQNKEKVCVRPTVIQVPGNRMPEDIKWTFHCFSNDLNKKIIIWTIHLTIKHWIRRYTRHLRKTILRISQVSVPTPFSSFRDVGLGHPPPPTPLFKAMLRVCNSHSR